MSRSASALMTGLVLVAGCAGEEPRPTEYLDQQTGVTIRTTAEPFVYAHAVPEIAANARDYLSLGAVEVDNMGTRKHYLVAVSWSTVDRIGGGHAAVPDSLPLAVSGRELQLRPVSHDARSLGIGSAPFRPPSGMVGESWYLVTPADLRAFVAAPPAAITLPSDAGSASYLLWRSASSEFEEFVRDIPDARR